MENTDGFQEAGNISTEKLFEWANSTQTRAA